MASNSNPFQNLGILGAVGLGAMGAGQTAPATAASANTVSPSTLGWQQAQQTYPQQYAAPTTTTPTWEHISVLQRTIMQLQATIIDLQKEMSSLRNIKEWVERAAAEGKESK